MGQLTKRFDIVAGRKYQTRSGEEKTHWINCGEAAEWDGKDISLTLRSVPVGNWFDGTLRLFERTEKDGGKGQDKSNRPTRGGPSQAQRDDFDDDSIPL